MVPDKGSDGAVISPLCSIREVAGRKLPNLAVIVYALAAGALARTTTV